MRFTVAIKRKHLKIKNPNYFYCGYDTSKNPQDVFY